MKGIFVNCAILHNNAEVIFICKQINLPYRISIYNQKVCEGTFF